MDKTKNAMKKRLKRFLSWMRGEQNLEKLLDRGLTIGKNFTRMEGVIIDPSHCWHITIGDNVTLAPNVHVLAHDASTKVFLNHTRVANTRIGNNVFVGAGSIILPGVTIGNNVVVGAGSVVVNDIPDDSVAVGNPARVVKPLNAFLEENKQKMRSDNVFDEQYTLRNAAFGEMERKALLEVCAKCGVVYVE
jgi:maltose O-acetyltransferase